VRRHLFECQWCWPQGSPGGSASKLTGCWGTRAWCTNRNRRGVIAGRSWYVGVHRGDPGYRCDVICSSASGLGPKQPWWKRFQARWSLGHPSLVYESEPSWGERWPILVRRRTPSRSRPQVRRHLFECQWSRPPGSPDGSASKLTGRWASAGLVYESEPSWGDRWPILVRRRTPSRSRRQSDGHAACEGSHLYAGLRCECAWAQAAPWITTWS